MSIESGCIINECNGLGRRKRGMCPRHYSQWRRENNLKRGKVCVIPECEQPIQAKDLCVVHYDKLRNNGTPIFERKRGKGRSRTCWPAVVAICSMEYCNNPVHARGYCEKHYRWVMQQREYVDKPRRKIRNGYVVVLLKDHPNAMRDGYVLEHVYVMSEHIGRPIQKGETIHHRNGLSTDNRITNLELWKSSHPPGQRVIDLLAWAREIIELYEGEEEKLND